MSIQAAQLIATISVLGAEKAKADLAATGTEAETFGGKMKNALVFGAAAAGVAIVGLAVESVKMAGDFQGSMTRLVTSAGESQGAIGMVSQGILQMSVDTATSTEQLSAGMYYVESSGYHAAAGLNVLKVAAEGAKSENADLDVVSKALTTTMVDYHMKSTDAAAAMNGLIASVQNGKTSLQDMASSMGAVLPIGSALHISFPQIAGSIDTMTNAGMSAEQASQNLAHVLIALSAPSKVATKAMDDVGLSAQQVKDAMVKQGLPEALQMIEEHVGKKFPAGSVAGEQALKNIMGGLVGVKLAAMLTGGSLDETKNNIAKLTAAMNDGSKGVMGWSDVQQTFNFKMDQAKNMIDAVMISIGTKLLPVVGNLISSVATAVSSFATWVTGGTVIKDTLKFIGDNAQVTIPIIAGLAAGVLAFAVTSIPPLIAAFGTWAAGAWAAAVPTLLLAWPILAVAAAVAGLVAGFIALYNGNAGFRSFITGLVGGFQSVWQIVSTNFLPVMNQIGAFLKANVLPILQQVGNFLVSTFQPVWQQLVQLWNSQLLPAFKQIWGALQPLGDSFKQIWQAIQPLMPVIKVLGEIIGVVFGVVIVATIGILVGLLKGAAQGIAGFFSGLATVIGGVVQIFTGVIQVVSGLLRFFIDLFTGQWSKLGADLGTIWQGIINIFQGAWNVIVGVFQAAWGLVSGIVSGFVSGIIGFFQGLVDKLVGHSIIPDMWNMILQWFTSLPQKILGGIEAFIGNLLSRFNALKMAGVVIFQNLVGEIGNALNGLGGLATAAWNGMTGAVKGGINNIIGLINGFINGIDKLHITIPGGQTIGFSIPDIPPLAAGGIIGGAGLATVGENGPEQVWLPQGAQVIPNSQSFGNGSQPIIVNAVLQVDGRMMANGLMPHIATAIRTATGVKF